MRIRPALPSDQAALYAIALATGDAGADASTLHRYPDLIGEVYVGPYLASNPQHAFALVDDDDLPRGYVLGTADSRGFETWAAERWWPSLRVRTALLDDPTSADRDLLARIREPGAAPALVVEGHPAHGHIDLLPDAQGHGYGRLLLTTLMTSVAAAGAQGIHLEVGQDNRRAQGFYARLGFTVIAQTPESVFLGRSLSSP